MKNIILIAFLILGCKTTNNKLIHSKNGSVEQVFIANRTIGQPGKCYQKMMLDGQMIWTEVLCKADLSKELIKQIQSNLVRLGYQLDNEELAKEQLGTTTKQGIKQFQQKNNMAFGGLDWATINKMNKTVE